MEAETFIVIAVIRGHLLLALSCSK